MFANIFKLLLFISAVELTFASNLITKLSGRIQNNMFQLNPLAETITHSIELAIENCQREFQWDRWNCPANDFLAKRSKHSLDREGAFVQAITVASIIYTVTKNCTKGETDICGCQFSEQNGRIQMGQCSEDVGHAELLLREIIENTNSPGHLDAQGYAEIHNSRAAQLAVLNSLKHSCKCHGFSGSCAMKTCWMSLDSFPQIARELRKMYDQAQILIPDNSGRIEQKISDDSLVYLLESPNYCQKNAIPGWTGMRGRQCSRSNDNALTTSSEKRSCKNLCRACGLRVKKEQHVIKRRCNCKFRWCCDVTCDLCTDVVEEYFCD